MFVQQILIYPESAHAGEARSTLEERIKTRPPGGIAGGLSQRVFGDLPVFFVSSIFEHLEDLEKDRDTRNADQSFQEYRSTIESMVRRPTQVIVSEIIIGGDVSLSMRYAHLGQFYPKDGKRGEVQAVLEEFTKGQQAAGRASLSLSRQLFSLTGPILNVRDTYQSLAENENVTRERRTTVAKLMSDVADLTRQPFGTDLRERLVSYGG